MAKRNTENDVEVMFKQSVTYGGRPYVQNKTAKFSESDANSLVAGGYAVLVTDEMREIEEQKKNYPQNIPLEEKNVVIATHDSGEQVAYPDPRERGPLSKDDRGEVEELPKGDLPTGVPMGAHQQAQEATKSFKATVKPPEVHLPEDGDDEKSKSKSSAKKSK